MKLTAKRLELFQQVQGEIEDELVKLARAYAKIKGGTIRGYFEKFEIYNGNVEITFEDSWQGGTDRDYVTLPLSVLGDDTLEAAAARAVEEKKAKDIADKKRQEELAALARKRQYDKLKEEFG